MSLTGFYARVRENRPLGESMFRLRLGDCGALAACQPGQFAMLRGDWGLDPIMPRAMSVMRAGGDAADFLVKEVGRGTALLRRAAPGDRIHVLGPMGRGFPQPSSSRRDLLVAGGVGLAPLLMQAERAAALGLGHRITICYGGRSAGDLVLQGELAATGAKLVLATEDGSRGRRGRVTEALDLADRPTVMACGPNPMLRAVRALALAQGLECWLSVEEKMACAVRACLGCAVPAGGETAKTRPYLYACVDGPVFEARALADSW